MNKITVDYENEQILIDKKGVNADCLYMVLRSLKKLMKGEKYEKYRFSYYGDFKIVPTDLEISETSDNSEEFKKTLDKEFGPVPEGATKTYTKSEWEKVSPDSNLHQRYVTTVTKKLDEE